MISYTVNKSSFTLKNSKILNKPTKYGRSKCKKKGG